MNSIHNEEHLTRAFYVLAGGLPFNINSSFYKKFFAMQYRKYSEKIFANIFDDRDPGVDKLRQWATQRIGKETGDGLKITLAGAYNRFCVLRDGQGWSAKPKHKKHYVYLLKAHTHITNDSPLALKIGMSVNPEQRAASFQIPLRIELLNVIPCQDQNSALSLEHRLLSKYEYALNPLGGTEWLVYDDCLEQELRSLFVKLRQPKASYIELDI